MDRDLDWIRRGLRFECQPDCGLCCTAETREGSVFLEREDLERLAGFWNLTPRAFAQKYCVDEYGELALAMQDNGSCHFLEHGECTVYEARPLQCRTYPFLPLDGFTPIASPYTWRYEKKFCPGIGKGRLYRKEEIRDITRGRSDVNGFEV
jgi:Fe-S-cluster containining protein